MGDGPNGSAEYVGGAIRASLERLRTDRVDLYYYHRPDGVTPIAETLGAMQELVGEGLVRAIGCSNFSAAQLAEADEFARASGGAALRRRAERVQPAGARGRGRGAAAWPASLGVALRPVLPARERAADREVPARRRRGRRGRASSERDIESATFDRLEALEAFARERGRSLLDLAIAALASQPGHPVCDRRCNERRAGARERRGGRLGALAGRPRRAGPAGLARCSHAAALGEGHGRTDEREVRERLREVPELTPRDGVVLLGEQADVVAEVEQPLEQLARLVVGCPGARARRRARTSTARKTPSPGGNPSTAAASSGR